MSIKIYIPEQEFYDEKNNTFIDIKAQTILMEHSLVSLHKWEQKWHIPFLGSYKTPEQMKDYLKYMTITQNVDPLVYDLMPPVEIKKINDYIANPMTATTFSNIDKKKKNRDIITAEIIYYWMIKLGIPVEFQKWHLNSLMTLIEVISLKEAPEKKMGTQEALRRQRELNAARRARLHTKG